MRGDAGGDWDRDLTGWPLGPPQEDVDARLAAEVEHVAWLLGLLEAQGYDLHALAHEREPLTGAEYARRYGGRRPPI
jgi:hypothetical protein